MGNFLGSRVQSAQSVVPTYTIESSVLYTQPEEGRMNISLCNFYRNQCRVLEKQLSFAEKISKKDTRPCDVSDVSSADLFWPQPALTELHRVLKAGRTLIVDCHDEPCLKAYMRQGERTLEFSELLKEITWCISVVFYYNSKSCMPGNPSIVMDEFPLAKLGAHKELYMLQKAALDDQKELLTSLDLWIQSHVCSAKECGRPEGQHEEDNSLCLAAQILKRRLSNDGGAPRAFMLDDVEPEHTMSVLWITVREALEDVREIGKGSFGTVFETTWLGDKYAKKEFVMVSKSFEAEVNALAKLNHPHIVKVSACYVAQDSEAECFFLMDIMPHDLRTHMNERMSRNRNSPPFKISAAIDVMLQISEAMSYMHSQGMVHRDLKAPNILVKLVDDPELCKEGFVFAKLVDFGLAKVKNEVTAYSHITMDQGTRRWMAPEVFKAYADDEEHLVVAYPRKADVYSFSIVCSEILTGKIPFQNVDFKMARLYELLTDSDNPLRPELPESCPQSLGSLIRECWHTDPRRRPTFTEISTMLRYMKGLLMLTDDGQLEPWMEATLRSLMVQGKQVSITNPHSLFFTTFNGSSWTAAVPCPHPMASPNGMSLADHHGTLVGVHRALEKWKNSRYLYWTTYTMSSSWTRGKVIGFHLSPSRPAVATFRDRLYCLYRGERNKIWCTSAGSNLNDAWTGAENVGGRFPTSDGPALAGYGDRLISVIRGFDNIIYWNYSLDGLSWSAFERLTGSTSASPAVAVYKNPVNGMNELYVCVRGMDRGTGGLFWYRLSGTKWSSYFRIEYKFGVLSGPALAVFNNQLVCTLQGPGDQLCYTTFDGLCWSQVSMVPSQYCQGEQGLCTINSKLFCVYGAYSIN